MVQLDSVPLGNDQHSWVLTSDGMTIHNGEVISRLKVKPEEGSVVVSLLGFYTPLSFIQSCTSTSTTVVNTSGEQADIMQYPIVLYNVLQ